MREMTLEVSEKLIQGATAKAVEMGIFISVAVVDAGGHIKQIVRMENAGWFSPEIALGKATASAAFRRDTEAMLERLRGKEIFATALTPLAGGKLIMAQGGLLVTEGEEILGAIGVSGASSEQDATCSKAGIENLK